MTDAEKQILSRTLAIIDTPEKWTQGTEARSALGNKVPSISSQAVCFCLIGALDRAGVMVDPGYYFVGGGEAPTQLAAMLGFPSNAPITQLVYWNDRPERTHAEVLQRLQDAIAGRWDGVGT